MERVVLAALFSSPTGNGGHPAGCALVVCSPSETIIDTELADAATRGDTPGIGPERRPLEYASGAAFGSVERG
jgi:hypothetical protein